MTDLHPSKAGVLLTNLGTPAAPTADALRPYLQEFLSDKYVIDYPDWLWQPILHGMVLRSRPAKSAAMYRRIWSEAGSPMLAHSRRLAQQVEARLQAPVVIGMRYGQPSLAAALDELASRGVERVAALPLYPQYSRTTTQTTIDVVEGLVAKCLPHLQLRWMDAYYGNESYLQAIAGSIRSLGELPPDARLLFSYHGLPGRYTRQGDPYEGQCRQTSQAVAQRLGLAEGQWATAFQSRFGPEPWLKPYTDKQLLRWAREGVAEVRVVAPGFSIDCLETLEELAHTYRELFLAAGGRRFSYIPALNDGAAHVELVTELVRGVLVD